MSVENQLSCGHPSTSRTDENVQKVHQAVLANRCRTSDETSEITGVSRSSCQCNSMEGLMMKWVVAKFVLRLLTKEHMNVCCDLQEQLIYDPQFLTKVVTGDEGWCYCYDRVKAAVTSV